MPKCISLKGGLYPKLYLPLLLLLCVVAAWHPLHSTDDFWAHAAVGRWIWQHGQVPHETLFLWSINPAPWVAHSWLTELAFYGLMAAGGEDTGPYLALAFTALIVALTHILLWRLWSRRAAITFLTALLFAVTILRGSDRFHPRPELFTALLLVCLLVRLVEWSPAAARDKVSLPRQRLALDILCLPLIFMVWANLHGGVIIGLVMLGATVICELIQEQWSKRAWTLAAISIPCVAAVLINPYGTGYWRALQPLGSPMFATIEEWKPVMAWPPVAESVLFLQGAMALVALLAWRLNPYRRTAHLAWLVLMALAYVNARRNGGLLGLVALVVMAANANSLDPVLLWKMMWPGWAQRNNFVVPPRWNLYARGSTLIVLCVLIFHAIPRRTHAPSFHAVSSRLCTKMAEFMEHKQLPARLFNDYETSSYLQWRLAGRRPLFVDLLNAYPLDLLNDYDDIAAATPSGLRKLDEFDIGIISFGWQSRPNFMSRLINFIDHDPGWVRIYDQEDGGVWVRRIPKNAHLW